VPSFGRVPINNAGAVAGTSPLAVARYLNVRSQMRSTRIIGVALVLGGLVLLPIGWMYFRWAHVASFVAILAGALFFSLGEKESPEGESDGELFAKRPTGRELPTDIHGHSGWQVGGRSASWEASGSATSSSDSSSSDAGGGFGD
jgi:hypothetical protein